MNGKKICTVLINIYLSFYVYENCYYIFHVLTIYKSKNWYKKVHTCINVCVMYHQFISCNLFWNTELHVLVHYKLDVCVQCSVKITKHLTLISLTLYLHIYVLITAHLMQLNLSGVTLLFLLMLQCLSHEFLS